MAAQLQTLRMTVLSDAPPQPAQLQTMRMTVLSDAPAQPAQLQTMRMTVLHDDTEASLGGDDGRDRRRKRRTEGARGRGFSERDVVLAFSGRVVINGFEEI